jgi:polyhydroxyalkanoate synthesis regulator phasin
VTTATEDRKTLTDQMTAVFLESLGTVCWAQDQGLKLTRAWLDQTQANRDQARKLLERVAEQVRSNQEELQRFIRSSVEMSLAAMRLPDASRVDDLSRRLEDLTRRLEELTRRVEELASARGKH